MTSSTGNATLGYRVVAVSQGEVHVIALTVNSAGARSEPYCLVVSPQDQAVGSDCPARTVAIPAGRTIEFYLPKIALRNPSSVEWKAEIANHGSAESYRATFTRSSTIRSSAKRAP